MIPGLRILIFSILFLWPVSGLGSADVVSAYIRGLSRVSRIFADINVKPEAGRVKELIHYCAIEKFMYGSWGNLDMIAETIETINHPSLSLEFETFKTFADSMIQTIHAQPECVQVGSVINEETVNAFLAKYPENLLLYTGREQMIRAVLDFHMYFTKQAIASGYFRGVEVDDQDMPLRARLKFGSL